MVNFLVQRAVLIGNNRLCLAIEKFDLVFDAVVHCFVKDFKNVVFLPYIGADIFKVLLDLEQLPKLQLLELFLLHGFFQFAQKLKQLSDKKVPHDI